MNKTIEMIEEMGFKVIIEHGEVWVMTDEGEDSTKVAIMDEDGQISCDHPPIAVEFDEDEPAGECLLCGAMCSTHAEFANVEEHYWMERVPHEWHEGNGGLIKKYKEEM